MWTYEDQMEFESDCKDSYFAAAAYTDDYPGYNEEDWDGICDTFYEEI